MLDQHEPKVNLLDHFEWRLPIPNFIKTYSVGLELKQQAGGRAGRQAGRRAGTPHYALIYALHLKNVL